MFSRTRAFSPFFLLFQTDQEAYDRALEKPDVLDAFPWYSTVPVRLSFITACFIMYKLVPQHRINHPLLTSLTYIAKIFRAPLNSTQPNPTLPLSSAPAYHRYRRTSICPSSPEGNRALLKTRTAVKPRKKKIPQRR